MVRLTHTFEATHKNKWREIFLNKAKIEKSAYISKYKLKTMWYTIYNVMFAINQYIFANGKINSVC